MRALRLRVHSARQTGARIRLEALGADDAVLGQTLFTADWCGDNDMQLWLDAFEPATGHERWSGVRALRMSCHQPGWWPTRLDVGEVEVSPRAPAWQVNESDTVVDIGWHYLMCRPGEWRVVAERSSMALSAITIRGADPMWKINREADSPEQAAEVYRQVPSPWLTFSFQQGDDPGRLTIERRLDFDLAGYSQALAKATWDKDARLTVTAVVDGGREVVLLDREAPHGDEWLTFGAGLSGARHLDAVRIELAEQEERKHDGRQVAVGWFWLLVRRPVAQLDEAPVESVTVRLAPTHAAYPQAVRTVEKQIRQVPFDDGPESATPIGDPLSDGLPMGFFVRRDELPALQERALRGPALRIFEGIRAEADRALATELVDRNNYGTDVGGGVGYPKGFRGAGMRTFGPAVAITHLITGEDKYAAACRRWILRAARSDDWRGEHGGLVDRPLIGEEWGYDDSFTGWHPRGFAGYMDHPFFVADSAFGIVTAYDMLYHCFNPAEREEVEQSFARHGTYILYDKLRQSRTFYVGMNQGVLFALPLLMQTAFLRRGDPVYEQMHRWTLEFLLEFGARPWSGEGVCGEGPGYGFGTVNEYVEALHPIAACLNRPVSDAITPALRNTMVWLQHVRSTWQPEGKPQFLGYSDASAGGWVQGDMLAFFSRYLRDGVAQHFWEERFPDDPPASLPTLLTVQGDTQATLPDLPPAKVFRDQPMAFLRTGWQPGDTLLALTNLRQVSGHGHLDRASVILEFNHEQLLLDPGMIGYSDPASAQYDETFCHNTLSLSGRSQSGGTAVFDTSIAGFLTTSGDRCPGQPGGIDWVIADSGAVYPEARRFHRHVVFLRPGIVVLFDDVETKTPETLELNFTCLGPLAAEGDAFVSTTRRNRLIIHTQATQPLAHRFSSWGTHWPHIPSYRLIRSTTAPARECAFVTVLAPHALADPAPRVEALDLAGWFGARIATPAEQMVVAWRLVADAAPLPGIETDARAVALRWMGGRLSGAAMLGGRRLLVQDVGPVLTADPSFMAGAVQTGGGWVQHASPVDMARVAGRLESQ